MGTCYPRPTTVEQLELEIRIAYESVRVLNIAFSDPSHADTLASIFGHLHAANEYFHGNNYVNSRSSIRLAQSGIANFVRITEVAHSAINS